MSIDGPAIFVRWLHVITACVVIGAVFFVYFLLPISTRNLEAPVAEAVFGRLRRTFKIVIHACVLLFLLSGIYNAWRAWHWYTVYPGLLHGIFGMHLLLAVIALTLLMIAFAGRDPRPLRRGLLRWALLAMILAVGAASTLKAGREWVMLHPRTNHPVGQGR